MGILSNLTNKLKSTAIKSLDTLSGIVTNPITAITKGTKASTAQFVNSKPAENVVKTITNIGLASAVVVGAGAVASGGVGVAGKAVKSLIPSSTKGKVITAVVTPVAIGVVASQPISVAKTISKAPTELANFGADLANLAVNPSLESAKNLVKESPVLTGLTALGVAGVVGAGTAGLIASVSNTSATKENTKAIQASGASVAPIQPQAVSIPSQPITASSTTPQTAQTQPLTAVAGSSSTNGNKKRRRTQQKPQIISQKVNVLVSNRNSAVGIKANKKYIKRSIYS